METNKAYPKFVIDIGGDTVTIVCNYRTIFNYEMVSGSPFYELVRDRKKSTAISALANFLYASIKDQNPKYTLDWVLDNFSTELIIKLTSEVLPKAIESAFIGKKEIEQEKKD